MIFAGNKKTDELIIEENVSDYCIMYGDARRGMSLYSVLIHEMWEQEYLRIRRRIREGAGIFEDERNED